MLYLVRHGRTELNASGRLLGRLDVGLDELGMRQAEALGRVEQLARATLVLSSPLRRARETAAHIAADVTVDESWTEIDYGVFDGLPVGEAVELWRRWDQDLGFVPEGGESLAELGSRVRDACERIWPLASQSDVVVVTHVSPLKAAVAWALGVGDEIAWRTFVDVASVTVVGSGRAGRPSLRSFNQTYHRPGS